MPEALINDRPVLDQAASAAVDLTIPAWHPRYRLLPGEDLPTVIQDRNRRLGRMRWGWMRGDAVSRGDLVTCVRGEDAPGRCVRPFVTGRCVVLATGFLVRAPGILASAMPNVIAVRCGLIALAALWKTEGTGPTASGGVVLLTTRAHEDLAAVMTRMPAILPFEELDAWLMRDTPHVRLRKLLQTYWVRGASVTIIRPDALDARRHDDKPELLRAMPQVYQ